MRRELIFRRRAAVRLPVLLRPAMVRKQAGGITAPVGVLSLYYAILINLFFYSKPNERYNNM